MLCVIEVQVWNVSLSSEFCLLCQKRPPDIQFVPVCSSLIWPTSDCTFNRQPEDVEANVCIQSKHWFCTVSQRSHVLCLLFISVSLCVHSVLKTHDEEPKLKVPQLLIRWAAVRKGSCWICRSSNSLFWSFSASLWPETTYCSGNFSFLKIRVVKIKVKDLMLTWLGSFLEWCLLILSKWCLDRRSGGHVTNIVKWASCRGGPVSTLYLLMMLSHGWNSLNHSGTDSSEGKFSRLFF